MNEQQGFFTQLGALLDRHFSQRRAAIPQTAATGHSGWLRWLARQIVPNVGTLLLIAVLILTQQVWARPLLSPASAPGPSATTVNYQGRLADPSGNPLDGTYGMAFSLWDAATGGNLVWGPESHATVPVSQGLFSVGLGSQTSGGIPTGVWNGDRYLQITVGGETLSPRELIRSVPIAGMALTVPDGAITASQIATGAVGSSEIADGTVSSTDLASNAVTTAQIADGAVTPAKAPLLLSVDGQNRILRWGNVVVTPDSNGTVVISFTPFPHGVESFVGINADYTVGTFYVTCSETGPGYVRVKLVNHDGTPRTGLSRIMYMVVGY